MLDYSASPAVCPNCGNFVSALNDNTGWCFECSPLPATADNIAWLNRNADHVEHYMAQGFSLTTSMNLVVANVRPVCVVCSKEIPHAKRGSVFCSRNKECRKLRRRYVYLYTERGFTKTEALAKILEERG